MFVEHKFDLFAFTETWFWNADITFGGYKCEEVYHKHECGGTVLLYLKNDISY